MLMLTDPRGFDTGRKIKQVALELILAIVRRNTAEEIFKELDKGIIPYEGFGAIIPASENSAYQKIKEKYLRDY